MENHPIPQDITGFQFKLIGDMTVKQFAYIAAGAIIGWITYILPLPFIIKAPLAIVFGAIGTGFAFLQVSGRPLDLMIAHFFKAVFSPTQYIYQKQGASLWAKQEDPNMLAGQQFKNFIKTKPKNKLDQKESVFFQNLNAYSAQAPNINVPNSIPSHYYARQGQPVAQPMPSPQAAEKIKVPEENQELIKTAALLEKELAQAKANEQKQAQTDPQALLDAHQKVLELQKQMNEMLTQKEELEKKLIEIQKNMNSSNSPVFTPSTATSAPAKETKFVRSIPHSMSQSVGLPSVPEFPNLLTGIIKDPRGNPLANVLVEVKDEEGNAVRAFKTNALGHFASATALNNGKYTISFEDPKGQNQFDSVAFEAKGEVIMPIEVISTDQREELRRSLFN